MDIETVRAKMLAQVDEARNSAMAQAFGWAIEFDDLIVYVAMRPRRNVDRTYLLRVCFDEFPKRAPSYLFVNRDTKQTCKEAWPPGVGHEDPPTGICTPGTREFHERFHQNDAQYPWDPSRFTFLATISEIHRMMERGIGG